MPSGEMAGRPGPAPPVRRGFVRPRQRVGVNPAGQTLIRGRGSAQRLAGQGRTSRNGADSGGPGHGRGPTHGDAWGKRRFTMPLWRLGLARP